MHDLPTYQRIYLSYIGRMYALTYRTIWKRFLGIQLSSWIKWGPLIILLAAWLSGFPWWLLSLIVLVVIWIRVTYRRAAKAGYSRFVVDQTAVSPTIEFQPLAPNERVSLRATGSFALSNRETNVLLRPADYWQAPLGDHTVMVKQGSQHFLYQFFNKQTVEDVHAGWLIFGAEPIQALAVTFCSKWGPNFADFSNLYYVRGGDNAPPCRRRIIYFTFADDRDHAAVWHNILQDLNHDSGG